MTTNTHQPFTMTANAILFNPSLPALVRVCYSALEDFSGEHRTCWPGYEAIAKKVGCSARWIPVLLKRLVEADLVVIQYRQGRTNIYTLLGRVQRNQTSPKATQEVTSWIPRKSSSYNQKPTQKTNERKASGPNNSGIDFTKYLPGGKYGNLTQPNR